MNFKDEKKASKKKLNFIFLIEQFFYDNSLNVNEVKVKKLK